jgi:hypothetical protein
MLQKIPTEGSEDEDRTDKYLREAADREEKEDRRLEIAKPIAELVGIVNTKNVTEEQVKNLEYATKKEAT